MINIAFFLFGKLLALGSHVQDVRLASCFRLEEDDAITASITSTPHPFLSRVTALLFFLRWSPKVSGLHQMDGRSLVDLAPSVMTLMGGGQKERVVNYGVGASNASPEIPD